MIVDRLGDTADQVGAADDPNRAIKYGRGRVNMANALKDKTTDVTEPPGTGGAGTGPVITPYTAAGISWQAYGAFTSGTGGLTVPLPAGYQDGDFFLLFVESANQAITLPSGWTEVTNSPQSTGTAAAAGGVRLGVFYKVVSGDQSSVSVTDTGNHTAAIIHNFRGVDISSPIDVTAGGVDATATASLSAPTVTTTDADALVVNAIGLDQDSATAATFSAGPTNANLTSLTLRSNNTTSSGVGGGVAVITGTKATAGSTGNTTGTLSASTTHAYISVALKPDTTAPVFSSVAPATNAVIKSITTTSDVSYTLSEAIASGSITMTRTGGTADASSPRTCTLKGTALAVGAHNNLDLSNTTNSCTVAQSLVDGAIYTFAFNGTDAAGNSATAVTNTGVLFDTTAPTAAITYSAAGPYKTGASVTITATFNEAMADSPLPKIAISGSNTVAATNMTKSSATVYTYTHTVAAGNGTATVALSSGTDVAGNAITTTPASGATFTVDNTAPTAAMSYLPTTGSYKSGASVTITATFNEAMADSPVPQIAISGANSLSAVNMTKSSATVYTYIHTVGAGNGTATVALSAGRDVAGNAITSAPTGGATFTVDNTPPTFSSSTPAGGSASIAINGTVTINWNEAVDCATVTDLTVTISGDGWAKTSCSGTQAIFTTSTQDSDRYYTVTIGTGVTDAAGNPMATAASFSYTTGGVSATLLDTGGVWPTATIGAVDYTHNYTAPAGTNRVVVVVASAESTTPISAVQVGGVAATTISIVQNGSAQVYTGYRVIGDSAATQTMNISTTGAMAISAATYGNVIQTAGTGTANTINSIASGTAASGTTVTTTSVYNAAGGAVNNVTGGVVIYAINMNNGSADGQVGTGTSTAWTFAEMMDKYETSNGNRTAAGTSTTTDSGSATISVSDGGTTHNRSALAAFAFNRVPADPTKPTVSAFTVTSPQKTKNIAISSFTGSDNVAVTGFMITRDSNTPPAASDAAWSDTAPSTYTVSTDGTYSLYPWVRDAVGNVSLEFASPGSVTVDTTPPAVTTVAVQTALTVDVTFNEEMGVGVTTAANFTVSGTGKGTLAGNPNSVAAVSGNTYRLTWTTGEMKNGGDITITVANVQDAAGNAIGATNSGIHTGGAIGVAPTAAITYSAASPYKSGTNVTITATFTEAMVDSPAPEIAISGLTGSTLSATAMTKSSSTVYTYLYTAGTGDGTATVAVSTGTDLAGNSVTSAPTSGASFTIDNTPPGYATSTPASGASNVTENSTVTINWNENVNCTTVSTSTVTISPAAGWSRTSCSGSQAVFTPGGQDYGTEYTVNIGAGVNDSIGNVTVSGSPFSYTTRVVAPTLTLPTATSIGSTSATLGATVSNSGGAAVTRGTVWGASATPTGNVVAEGGTTSGAYSHSRTSLTPASLTYYRGYATNIVGTSYSTGGSFYTEPATQASGLNMYMPGETSMRVSWTRGGGSGVIVLMKLGSAPASAPADGTYSAYTANSAFANPAAALGDGYIVYKGDGTSVDVTGLTLESSYHVAVYEYAGTVDSSGVNQGTNYLTTLPATASRTMTPAKTYYSTGSLPANSTTSWNTKRNNSSGTAPVDFGGIDTFIIQSGHSMTTTADWTLSSGISAVHIEDGGALTASNNISSYLFQIDENATLTINSGKTLTINNSASDPDLILNGTLVNSGRVTLSGSTMSVGATGTYRHNTNTLDIPVATWDAASTLHITGITTGGTLTGTDRALGNVKIETALITELFFTDSADTVVHGDLSILKTSVVAPTATDHFAWSGSTPASPVADIRGSLKIESAGTDYASFEPFHASGRVKIGGNYSQTAGTTGQSGIGYWESTGGLIWTLQFTGGGKTITGETANIGAGTIGGINLTIDSGASLALANNITLTAGNLTVNGSLDLGAYTAQRSASGGIFTMGSGSTLLVGGANNFPSNYSNSLDAASTVNYNRSGDQTVFGGIYGNLTLSGSGTRTVGAATVLRGNWTNSGNLAVAGNYTVTFRGAGAQSITGNNSWYALVIDNVAATAARTVSFASGNTQSVSNALTMTGNSSYMLNLAGTSGGWTISAPASHTVNYVNPANSTASGTMINAYYSTDGGGNTNWNIVGVNACNSGATAWRSFTSGDWGDAGTWQCQTNSTGSAWYISTAATPPATSSALTVTILGGHTVTVAATASSGGAITVNSGGTVSISSGVGWTILNSLTVNGTLVNNSTTAMTMTGTMSVGAGGTYQHAVNTLVIPDATWANTSTLYITGITSSGTTSGLSNIAKGLGNVKIECDLTAELFLTNSGSTVINGDLIVVKTSSGAVSATNHFAWSSLAVAGVINGNLRLEAPSGYAAFEPFHATGTITINGGYNQSGNSGIGYWETTIGRTFTLNFNGTGTIGGTLLYGATSAVTINPTIVAAKSYSLSANTVHTPGLANLTSTFTVNGTLDLGSNTLTSSTTGSTTFTLGANGLLKVGGAANFPSGFDTITTTSGTVEYNMAGSQSVSSRTYNKLTISGSGVKTALGTLTITGDLNISAGTLDLSTFTANRSSAGGTLTVANGATLIIGDSNSIPGNYSTHSIGTTSTIEYDGTSQTIGALNSSQSYGNISLSGSGTKTLGGAISVAGNWTNSSDLTLAGNYTVTFNGSGDQTISGSNSWYGLAATGGGRAVKFASAKTQSIASGGSLTFTGTPSGPKLTLAPVTLLSAWNLTFNGATQSVTDVAVSYSNASGGIPINATAGSNTDGGNNTNWGFTPDLELTYTSSGTGNWNTGSTWVGGVVPHPYSNVTIAAGHAVTNSVARSLNTLTINGTLVNGAAVTTIGTMSVGATGTYKHDFNSLVIPPATWNAASTLHITGIVNGGQLTGTDRGFGNVKIDTDLDTELFFTTSDLSIVNGDLSIIRTSILPPTATNHFAWATTGTSTLDVRGNLYIQSAGTDYASFEPFHSSGIIKIGGNYNQTAGTVGRSGIGLWETSSAYTWTLQFTGTDKTITGSISNIGSGTITGMGLQIDGSVTLANNVTLTTGSLTVNDTLDLDEFTANRSATGGTFTLNSGAILKVGGTGNFPSNYSTDTLDPASSVEYNMAGAQTISAQSYGNLILSGSGTKTLAGSMTVKGNWTNHDDLALDATTNTATVTFSGTDQTIIGNNIWYGLAITGTTARTVLFEATKMQTINSGGSLTLTGAVDQLLNLDSTNGTDVWYLIYKGGEQNNDFVSPSRSNADAVNGGSTIYAANSVIADRGNINWDVASVPTLSSPTATSVALSTATLGATVTGNGNNQITARGACWGTTTAPETNCTAEGGTGITPFSTARSGITEGTKIYYRGYATNAVGTGYSADGTFYTEPTTQASAASFTIDTLSAVTIEWTRGSGDGVIVLMKQSNTAITEVPTDGTRYSDVTGSIVLGNAATLGTSRIVYKGSGTSVPVTGLSATTATYQVAVFEYKGDVATSGADQGTNYKGTPATNSITMPATVYYSKGNLAANTASNWNTARNGSGTNASSFTGAMYVIQNGHTMTTSAAWTLNTSIFQIESGGRLNATFGITLTTSTMKVLDGGTYQHNHTGTTIPTATWESDSTLYVTGFTSGTLANTNQTFGNIVWNVPTQSGQAYLSGTANVPARIAGNLIINNTGTASASSSHLHWSSSTTTGQSVTLGGDLIIQNTGSGTQKALWEPWHGTSGTFTINIGGSHKELAPTGGSTGATGSGCFHGSCGGSTWVMNMTGTDKTLVGGLNDSTTTQIINFNIGSGSNTPSYSLDGNATDGNVIAGTSATTPVTLTVNSGATLNAGSYADKKHLTGTGAFTVASGGTLVIADPYGITTSTASATAGSVQVSGTRTYGAANYAYNGTASQAAGSGLPATLNNLTISNSGAIGDNIVSLAQAATVNGNVNITAGVLASNGFDMTVKGNWTSVADLAFAAGSRTVTFSGTGAQTISGSNTWYGLNINNSAATAERTVSFASAATPVIQTVGNNLTLTGTATYQLLLAPTDPAYNWEIHAPATQSVQYVTPSYSDASSGIVITAYNSTNGGNNTNWRFAPPVPISATQYKSNGTAAIVQGGTTFGSQLVFSAYVYDEYGEDLILDVEVVPSSGSFTGTKTCSSSVGASGRTATTLASACGSFTSGTAYKWQYRTTAPDSLSSNWVPYGGNPDFTISTVTSTSPASGGTGIAANQNVAITWSENVNCTTVTTSNITINPQPGIWTRTSCSGNQAVFSPTAQSINTSYTVTVGTGVTDSDGIAMGANYPFTYQTGTASTYYSAQSGAAATLTNWKTNRNNSGSSPANFTTAGNVYVIQSTHTMTGAWTISGAGATVEIESGGILTPNALSTPVLNIDAGGAMTTSSNYTVAATLFALNGTYTNGSSGAITGTITVGSTGTYTHAIAGGTIPTATWSSGSTLNITGATGAAPSGLGISGTPKTFSNIIWNCTGQTAELSPFTYTNINGNLTVGSTGSNHIHLTSNTSATTFAIGGDLTVTNGARFEPSQTTGTLTINVGGSFLQEGTGFIGDLSGGANWTFNFTGTNKTVKGIFSDYGTGAVNINATIASGATYTMAGDVTIGRTTPADTGTLTVASGGTLNTGAFTVLGAGRFALASGGTLGVGSTDGIASTGTSGSIQTSGTRSFSTTANYTFNGTTGGQVTGSGTPSTVSGLKIDNSSGLTLSGSKTVSGALSLANGNITTGGYTVTVGSAGSISGGSTSSFVYGKLVRTVAKSGTAQSAFFPVGDAATYAPVTLDSVTVTTSGTISATTTGSDHASLATSTIRVSKSANRYWSLINTGTVFTGANATFNFAATDLDASTDPLLFLIQRYAGSAWNSPAIGTLTATSSEATGITNATLGDFAVGEEKATPTLSVTNSPITYNGAPQAATITGSVPGTVNAVYTGGTAAQTDVGTYAVTGSFTPTNTGDYKVVNGAAAGNFIITQKPLTITATASSKVYDGTTNATLSVAPALLASEVAATGLTTDGKPYTVDGITITGTPVGRFSDRHVAVDAKTVTITGLSLNGTGIKAGNYSLPDPTTTTASITAKELTLTGSITASDKVYDATTTATLTGSAVLQTAEETVGPSTTGDGTPYSIDDVSLVDAHVGNFSDKNVGTLKTVTITGYSLAGTYPGNYSLTQPTTNSATITAKPLTALDISVPASKVYDCSTTATVSGTPILKSAVPPGSSGGSAVGAPFTGDTLGSITGTATGTYNSKDVSTATTVTFAGMTLDGTDGANYIVTGMAPATITTKALTVSGITAANKVYDASRVATLRTGSTIMAGNLSCDNSSSYVLLDATSATGEFDNADIGTNKLVQISGLTLGGSSKDNYSMVQPTTTASISGKTLTVSGITASNKEYDGTTTVTINTDGAALVGNFDGINVVLDTAAALGVFSSATVGTGKTVQISGLTISGSASANYRLTQPTTTANITKATPTVSAWPSASTVTLGATLATSTLTGGGASVPGRFTFTTPGTVVSATGSQDVTFTPTDSATYNSVAGTVNVVGTNVPTITAWPTASAVTVGDTLSSSTLSGGSASVGGTFAWTTPDTVLSTVGTISQSVNFTPSANSYSYTTVTGTVSVKVNQVVKVTPTITTSPAGSAITYGQALAYSTLSGGVASVPGTFAWTTSTEVPNAGTYNTSNGNNKSVTFTPSDTTRYNTAVGTASSITVNRRPLTITADTLSKVFAGSDPTLTWTVTSSSLVGTDTISVGLSRASGEAVKGYAISYDFTTGGKDVINANYELTGVTAFFYIDANVIFTTPTNGRIIGPTTARYNTTPEFHFVPNVGYKLSSLTINGKPITNVYTYTEPVAGPTYTIVATFVENKVLITSSVSSSCTNGTGGLISPLGVTSVVPGSSQMFLISPNANCAIEKVVLDEATNPVNLGIIANYNFTNVTVPRTIKAYFKNSTTIYPVISTVSPATLNRGAVATLITITGINFGGVKTINDVIFSNTGVHPVAIKSYNPTKVTLTVSVDSTATPGIGTVKVKSSTTTLESNTYSFTVN